MEWDKEVYYVVVDGKPTGPFTHTELAEMKLKSSDFVRTSSMPEFKELREIQGLSGLLGVKHQQTLPQYYATLDVRLLAFGIDFFIAVFIYALFAIIYLFSSEADDPQRIPYLIMGLVSVPLIKWLFSSILEGSARQASPGKAFLGITVTNTQGGPAGYGKAFLRNFSKILGVVTLGLGFLSGFFDKKQQCLHDKVAGTWVIKSRLI